jgi:hypothetical protein
MAFDHDFSNARELLRYAPEAVATAVSFAFVAYCVCLL